MEKQIKLWLQEPFDQATRASIQELMKTNPKELEDCFYTDLTFGTGGLRGLMGVGTNRMNRYTVRRTTLGLANYLKKQFADSISVVIGFDSRHHSEEFAKEAANTLIQSGLDVFFLKELRPTPYVSFACRHLQAKAAIMITASHNPKEYNGYKVYWQDGAQVVHPHDTGILEEITKIQTFDLPLSEHQGTLHLVDESLDKAYLEAIRPLQNTPPIKNSLKIAYTSLHGTGITLIPKALQDWGFSCITLVESQKQPNGDFPTVRVPNPEYVETLKLGIETMTTHCCDILLASDPDADRLAVVINDKKPVPLTGNEIACICLEYLCLVRKHKLTRPAMVTTIVSSPLLRSICQAHDILHLEVLTGFKYIGEKIHQWELSASKSPEFLFGAEESYGYLYGTHSRDKDAIISCCLIAEIALFLQKQGLTLLDFLYDIYKKYGVFREKLLSIEFSVDHAGQQKMCDLMNRLRKTPPKQLLGLKIAQTIDYLQSSDLPSSDVLSFYLEDESRLVIRPSGTEPKIKIYASVKDHSSLDLNLSMQKADEKLAKLLAELKKICLS